MDTPAKENNEHIKIYIDSAAVVNYAAVQNNVPIINSIRLENKSEFEYKNLELKISSNPAFIDGCRFTVEKFSPGDSYTFTQAKLNLGPNHSYLFSLDEAERGELVVSVSAQDSAEIIQRQEIKVLARNEWGAMLGLPEILAAHVLPNSAKVEEILKVSADLVVKVAGLAMDGYQSKNRDNVFKQISAIYKSIGSSGIQYAPPAASFERTGQKIRTPEKIYEAQLATCLDSAVLLASCFEQAGLNPVILLKEGHAWVGVWLIDSTFPFAIEDSVQDVRKRVASGELLIFESTAVTTGSVSPIINAIEAAKRYIDDNTEGEFLYAVDIKRSRQCHILPMRGSSNIYMNNGTGELHLSTNGKIDPVLDEVPVFPPLDPSVLKAEVINVPDTPQGRLNNWKSKLLDLTLRNKLLNFKPTKKFLKIITHDLSALEDALASDAEFKLIPKIDISNKNDPRSEEIFRNESGISSSIAHAKTALLKKEICFDASKEELIDIATSIYRDGKSALEESGCNSLYITIGMLEWKETADAETTLKAPILLIPVRLKRGSVGSGIRLERLDEETLFNPTLQQKLLHSFEIRLPYIDGKLPIDDSGVDVSLILQTMRSKIQELKGFEVKEECYLGNFSFTKYVMWKDLESNHEELAKNKVVGHLINNKGENFKENIDSVLPVDIDHSYSPKDLYTPLLCDSSQLAVICTAERGKNMVVEGPPGTGKSQTITNLISHFLASGKTVLFVAEKMAALEVVHKRLAEIGLSEFCLELHSAKAKKGEVAKQFVETLGKSKNAIVDEWEMESERLVSLRSELNGLVSIIHRRHRNGMTVYEAIGSGIANKDIKTARFEWSDPDIHDLKERINLEGFVTNLAALAGRIDPIHNHPLIGIGQTEWTPKWEENLFETSKELIIRIKALELAIERISEIVDLDKGQLSLSYVEGVDLLASSLMAASKIPAECIEQAFDQNSKQFLRDLIKHGKEREAIWSKFNGYDLDIKNLDGKVLKQEWRTASHDWWPKKIFTKRKVTGKLRMYNSSRNRETEANVEALLQSLVELNIRDSYLNKKADHARVLLGSIYSEEHSNWDLISEHVDWMEQFSAGLNKIHQKKIEEVFQIRDSLKTKIKDQYASFEEGGKIHGAAQNLKDSYVSFKGSLENISLLAKPREYLFGLSDSPSVFTNIRSILQKWAISRAQLQPWCVWNAEREKALKLGLSALIESVENGDVALQKMEEYYKVSYAEWWLRCIMNKEPLLSGFSGATHIQRIQSFIEADKRFQELTIKFVRAKLMAAVPSERELVDELSAEAGFLRREAQKQRQHKSIRELIEKSPNILPRIKPCLLMSPQSVAQYLKAGGRLFDVVIFDEASQIPTWDAVGAIARGKQLICVGDPKQLPPTNFFNATDSEGVFDDGNIMEMESILDECLSVGMPLSRLGWHYRSRNEGLITFSNFQYYDSSLVTFPSPVEKDNSVEFIDSKGVYDSGKSRTNPIEARMVVDEISRHYLDGYGSKHSIGVITFNSSQQGLIEKLLDNKRLSDKKLDQAIAESGTEELFIKNLENVQGDERDVILFSITFGKDATGKLSMNFGPMNKEGGHRRLNVAATRARHKVKVFSSMRPEDIDLSRTNARGVTDLKAYLDYALNGPRVLCEQALPTGREPDSPFEVSVIKELRERGWQVVPQVGVSGYRIDIAVIDKRNPGRFLLGIECDGATYHSAPSARDRDRLRQLILEGLGWKIHRIWSTDWWFNKKIPLDSLLKRLQELDSSVSLQ
jgi:hypothetical protein